MLSICLIPGGRAAGAFPSAPASTFPSKPSPFVSAISDQFRHTVRIALVGLGFVRAVSCAKKVHGGAVSAVLEAERYICCLAASMVEVR